jgi:hypothetical protein
MPSTTRYVRWIFAIVVYMGACGLFSRGTTLPPEEVTDHGTAVFEAPPDAVFVATKQALATLGYHVAAEDDDEGRIVTERKLVGERATAYGGSYSATAVSVRYYKQYEVTVSSTTGGSTEVVAIPRVFANEVDISDRPVWMVDGAAGERAAWQKMFATIDEFL